MTKRDPDFEKEQGEVYGRVWKEEREGRCDVKYIGATKYKLQLFFVLFVCVVCFNHPKINLYQNAKKNNWIVYSCCTHYYCFDSTGETAFSREIMQLKST